MADDNVWELYKCDENAIISILSPSLYFVSYDDEYDEDLDIVFSCSNFSLGGRFFFGG